jgi:hypothetical protein
LAFADEIDFDTTAFTGDGESHATLQTVEHAAQTRGRTSPRPFRLRSRHPA